MKCLKCGTETGHDHILYCEDCSDALYARRRAGMEETLADSKDKVMWACILAYLDRGCESANQSNEKIEQVKEKIKEMLDGMTRIEKCVCLGCDKEFESEEECNRHKCTCSGLLEWARENKGKVLVNPDSLKLVKMIEDPEESAGRMQVKVCSLFTASTSTVIFNDICSVEPLDEIKSKYIIATHEDIDRAFQKVDYALICMKNKFKELKEEKE